MSEWIEKKFEIGPRFEVVDVQYKGLLEEVEKKAAFFDRIERIMKENEKVRKKIDEARKSIFILMGRALTVSRNDDKFLLYVQDTLAEIYQKKADRNKK